MNYEKAIENIDLVLSAMSVDNHLSCATCQRRIKKVFAEFKQLHTEFAERETENEQLKSQQAPCSTSCYHHQTHPCENCGRINGYLPSVWKALIEK